MTDPQVVDAPGYRLLDAGDAALVVEFGDRVDRAINENVLALDADLTARPPPGLLECVPTYRSLMIHYDPLMLNRPDLVRLVEALIPILAARPAAAGRRWLIPCCYSGRHGEDLAEIGALLDLSPEAVVRAHVEAVYRVYMCGFAPGYAYLGDIPRTLEISRRPAPRAPHPTGAILLGGGLGAVASCSMPTGWYVIGATPERLFVPERPEPFLLRAGDALQFEQIDEAAFAALAARAAAGEPVAKQLA